MPCTHLCCHSLCPWFVKVDRSNSCHYGSISLLRTGPYSSGVSVTLCLHQSKVSDVKSNVIGIRFIHSQIRRISIQLALFQEWGAHKVDQPPSICVVYIFTLGEWGAHKVDQPPSQNPPSSGNQAPDGCSCACEHPATQAPMCHRGTFPMCNS